MQEENQNEFASSFQHSHNTGKKLPPLDTSGGIGAIPPNSSKRRQLLSRAPKQGYDQLQQNGFGQNNYQQESGLQNEYFQHDEQVEGFNHSNSLHD